MDYFKELFTISGRDEMDMILEKVQGRGPPHMNEMLAVPVATEEVVAALKHMHPTKSPGSDGMPTLFL